MPPTTETELKELRDLVIGLREEIRVGFAKVDTKFAEVNGEIQRIEAKTDTKLAEVQGQINVLEERTSLLGLYCPCGDYCINNSFSDLLGIISRWMPTTTAPKTTGALNRTIIMVFVIHI
jgi:hypothetical protein